MLYMWFILLLLKCLDELFVERVYQNHPRILTKELCYLTFCAIKIKLINTYVVLVIPRNYDYFFSWNLFSSFYALFYNTSNLMAFQPFLKSLVILISRRIDILFLK